MSVTTDKIDEHGFRDRYLDYVEEVYNTATGETEYIYHYYYFQFYPLDKAGERDEVLADACYEDLYFIICNKYLITEEGNSYWDEYVFALIQSTSGNDVFFSGRYDVTIMRERLSGRLGMEADDVEILTSRRYYNRTDAVNKRYASFYTQVKRGREGRRDGSIGGRRRAT